MASKGSSVAFTTTSQEQKDDIAAQINGIKAQRGYRTNTEVLVAALGALNGTIDAGEEPQDPYADDKREARRVAEMLLDTVDAMAAKARKRSDLDAHNHEVEVGNLRAQIVALQGRLDETNAALEDTRAQLAEARQSYADVVAVAKGAAKPKRQAQRRRTRPKAEAPAEQGPEKDETAGS